MAYLRLLANPRDGEALKRVINYPPRGVGEKTQESFFQAAATATATAGGGRRESIASAGGTNNDAASDSSNLSPSQLPIVDLLIELGLTGGSGATNTIPSPAGVNGKRKEKTLSLSDTFLSDGSLPGTSAERLSIAREKRKKQRENEVDMDNNEVDDDPARMLEVSEWVVALNPSFVQITLTEQITFTEQITLT